MSWNFYVLFSFEYLQDYLPLSVFYFQCIYCISKITILQFYIPASEFKVRMAYSETQRRKVLLFIRTKPTTGGNDVYIVPGAHSQMIKHWSTEHLKSFCSSFTPSSSSSSSGATVLLFTRFDLLNYFLPFNPIMFALCPVI